jgi:hypothetical protein
MSAALVTYTMSAVLVKPLAMTKIGAVPWRSVEVKILVVVNVVINVDCFDVRLHLMIPCLRTLRTQVTDIEDDVC